MAAIQRGASCRLKFNVLTDVDLTTLGDPAVAISQEYVFLTFEDDQITVDNANHCVYVDMSEAETMALAENAETKCQMAFSDPETERVVRFPVHTISVQATLMDTLL